MSSLQRDLQLSTHGHGHGQVIHIETKQNPHYNFLVSPSSIHPTCEDEFPLTSFEAPTLYAFSTSTSLPNAESPETSPSPDSESPPGSLLPELYSRKPATRLRSGNRVPRPRNAFMIFRSEFWAGEKISSSVERDHRHISRIIGHCWNQLSETEKDVWRLKAEHEKIEHHRRYPGYRFSPTIRKKKPVKRKVKRNGKEELLRCKQVAALILAGKEGEELDTAVKDLPVTEEVLGIGVRKSEDEKPSALAPLSNMIESESQLEHCNISSNPEAPAFRSPLLPPMIPTNGISSRKSVEVDSLATDYATQYHTVGAYLQRPYWNAPGSSEYLAPSYEYYIGDTAHPTVLTPRNSSAHVTSYGAISHYQNYNITPTVDLESTSTQLQMPTSRITFQNPFEFPPAFLPYVNQPRPPLDPLQWDPTSYSA